MQQKLITVNLEKLCDERVVLMGLDPKFMTEEEQCMLFARVVDDVLEQQNSAGFRVIASRGINNGTFLFLCTKSPITTPQHAKLAHLWEKGGLDELTQVNRSDIADLRLKGMIAEMNAARLTVDAVAPLDDGYVLTITTEV